MMTLFAAALLMLPSQAIAPATVETREAVVPVAEDDAPTAEAASSRTVGTAPRVNAGAQVLGNESCFDGTTVYDPYRRDGAWWCAASVGARASAGVGAEPDAD